MSLYTLSTWFIAILLYPVILFFYLSGYSDFDPELFGIYFFMIFYTIVFSLPSLLISMLTTTMLAKLTISNIQKFALWLVAAMLIVVINFYTIFLLFISEKELSWDLFNLAIPAMIAVVIVIGVRHQSFFNAVEKLRLANYTTDAESINENENSEI